MATDRHSAYGRAVGNALRQELKEMAHQRSRLSVKKLVDDPAAMQRLGERAVEAYERFEWQMTDGAPGA